MKKVSIFGVSILSVIAVATMFFYNSCTDDPCKDVVCVNGNCVDGTCACDVGYEGSDCSIRTAEKFEGQWKGTDNCTSGQYVYTATIASSSASKLSILITNFGGTGTTLVWSATIDGSNFTITNQSLGGYTITATGSISSDEKTISVNYTLFDGSNTDNCTGTWSLQ